MKNSGYVLLIDSLVALFFLFVMMTAIFSIQHPKISRTEVTTFRELHFMSEDVLDVLNKEGSLDDIATSWAEGDLENASDLSLYYFERMVPEGMGYMLTIDDQHICNSTRNENRTLESESIAMTHSTRLLVGFGRDLPVLGYVAEATLSAISSMRKSSYAFFGGFEGNGNITKIIVLPPDADILGGYIEVDAIQPFNIYVNGGWCKLFDALPDNMTAENETLDGCFTAGENRIDLNFTEGDISTHYIGGGYIRIDYETNETDTGYDYGRYDFPGIDGIINVYSSFYVPGYSLSSMDAYLHYYNNMTNASVYLTIADTTVSLGNATGERKITLTQADNFSAAGLDLSTLERHTTPLRLGTNISNITETITTQVPVDVVLTTDRSFSMWNEDCMEGDWETLYSSLGGIGTISDSQRYCPARCFYSYIIGFDRPCHFDPGCGRSTVGDCGFCRGGCWASYGCDCAYGYLTPCYQCSNTYFDTFEVNIPAGEEDSGVIAFDATNCPYISPAIPISEFETWAPGYYSPVNADYLCYIYAYSTPRRRYYYFGVNGTSDADRTSPTPADQCSLYTCSSDDWTVRTSSCHFYGLHGCDKDYVRTHRIYEPDGLPEMSDLAFTCGQVVQKCELTRIGLAKRLDRMFVNQVLNYSDATVGLVSYATDIRNSKGLSKDNESLIDQVNDYKASGETCICCAIEKAIEIFEEEDDPSHKRYLLLMSDGEANVECPVANTGDAADDAIELAREAHDDYGITIHTVGFDSSVGKGTLEEIAQVGGGEYYEGNTVSELEDIYEDIAETIVASATHVAQTIVVGGDVSMNNTLYPDSHINLSFSSIAALREGEIAVTLETAPFGNSLTNGSFKVPNGTRIIDAKVTSYSGAYWTDRLYVKNATDTFFREAYLLSDYAGTYESFGDPYTVNIQLDKLSAGLNFVNISAGIDRDNSVGGSGYDRAIYTIAVKAHVGYGTPKKSYGEGCNWTVQFYDGTKANVMVPSYYMGSKTCNYTPGTFDKGQYDNSSAIDDAVYRLFTALDIYSGEDPNGELDVKFDPEDIAIESTITGGVRSLWGPARVKLILWQ
jgi:hypothetical protein